MSYSDGPVINYPFPAVDFGAGGGNFAIKAPKGFSNGTIIEVSVTVTETFNAVTTAGFVRVGTSTDADAYVELAMGTAAATDAYGTADDPDAILDPLIPSGTQVEVACVAPTGGTPAGIGTVNVAIQWY